MCVLVCDGSCHPHVVICRFATTMAASDYKYVILGGGQAAGYTAREVPDLLISGIRLLLCPACIAHLVTCRRMRACECIQ